ncbi:hypothetical protein cand_036120 [Cryptosporidium andersoni]|uniref:Uncharacterized protein n=1 Tax=Cryptosporidium andersoni TaxID=117008 RepID=A0A1J4MV92_9CRYT|nr:hypothetical protein cand_036120 [Cryptosporidium andersoni]
MAFQCCNNSNIDEQECSIPCSPTSRLLIVHPIPNLNEGYGCNLELTSQRGRSPAKNGAVFAPLYNQSLSPDPVFMCKAESRPVSPLPLNFVPGTSPSSTLIETKVTNFVQTPLGPAKQEAFTNLSLSPSTPIGVQTCIGPVSHSLSHPSFAYSNLYLQNIEDTKSPPPTVIDHKYNNTFSTDNANNSSTYSCRNCCTSALKGASEAHKGLVDKEEIDNVKAKLKDKQIGSDLAIEKFDVAELRQVNEGSCQREWDEIPVTNSIDRNKPINSNPSENNTSEKLITNISGKLPDFENSFTHPSSSSKIQESRKAKDCIKYSTENRNPSEIKNSCKSINSDREVFNQATLNCTEDQSGVALNASILEEALALEEDLLDSALKAERYILKKAEHQQKKLLRDTLEKEELLSQMNLEDQKKLLNNALEKGGQILSEVLNKEQEILGDALLKEQEMIDDALIMEEELLKNSLKDEGKALEDTKTEIQNLIDQAKKLFVEKPKKSKKNKSIHIEISFSPNNTNNVDINTESPVNIRNKSNPITSPEFRQSTVTRPTQIASSKQFSTTPIEENIENKSSCSKTSQSNFLVQHKKSEPVIVEIPEEQTTYETSTQTPDEKADISEILGINSSSEQYPLDKETVIPVTKAAMALFSLNKNAEKKKKDHFFQSVQTPDTEEPVSTHIKNHPTLEPNNLDVAKIEPKLGDREVSSEIKTNQQGILGGDCIDKPKYVEELDTNIDESEQLLEATKKKTNDDIKDQEEQDGKIQNKNKSQCVLDSKGDTSEHSQSSSSIRGPIVLEDGELSEISSVNICYQDSQVDFDCFKRDETDSVISDNLIPFADQPSKPLSTVLKSSQDKEYKKEGAIASDTSSLYAEEDEAPTILTALNVPDNVHKLRHLNVPDVSIPQLSINTLEKLNGSMPVVNADPQMAQLLASAQLHLEEIETVEKKTNNWDEAEKLAEGDPLKLLETYLTSPNKNGDSSLGWANVQAVLEVYEPQLSYAKKNLIGWEAKAQDSPSNDEIKDNIDYYNDLVKELQDKVDIAQKAKDELLRKNDPNVLQKMLDSEQEDLQQIKTNMQTAADELRAVEGEYLKGNMNLKEKVKAARINVKQFDDSISQKLKLIHQIQERLNAFRNNSALRTN